MTTPNNRGVNLYLPNSIYLPDDLPQMLIRLQAYLTEISLKVNMREIGIYQKAEIYTGEIWFNEPGSLLNQTTLRQVYTFGAIPAGTQLLIPHNIVAINGVTFTHIYGTAINSVPLSLPLPFVDVNNVTNQISLFIGPVNIAINVGATAPALTSGIVVLEYLKN